MLSDYRAFLTQFLRNYQTTGSVLPSSRALASALCRHVGTGAPQRILEAGPGTGAVTGADGLSVCPLPVLRSWRAGVSFVSLLTGRSSRGRLDRTGRSLPLVSGSRVMAGSLGRAGLATAPVDLVSVDYLLLRAALSVLLAVNFIRVDAAMFTAAPV